MSIVCCLLGDLMFGYVDSMFLYKQKTAYDRRISDWSSDVCPSDLTVATALGDERIDRLQYALAGAAITVGMQLVGERFHRRHQFRRSRQRAPDRRLELCGIINVDQLRPRTPVLERDHRLVGQQELVERRRGVRAHQVDLREQLQDVVVLGEAQVDRKSTRLNSSH